MKTIDELKAAWNSMSPQSNGYILIETDHPLEFHIGYAPADQKCFIVKSTGMIDGLKSSKAITVQCGQFVNDEYSLRFMLVQNRLEDLFIKLCWNLIDASQGEVDGAVDRLIGEYENWQKLFQHLRTHALSSYQQKGLIAELLFLSEMIHTLGADDALTSWVGPEGSDQDFIFSDTWTEVKATSIASDKVAISSLQQLDRTDNGKLVVFRMDKTTSHGATSTTLQDMIDRINEMLPNDRQRDRFECKLIKAGLLSGDYYRQSDRYIVARRAEYRIIEGFPRLIPSNVPGSVVEAKYSISLSSVASYKGEEVQWQWM